MALVFSGYAGYREYQLECQLSAARDDAAKQGKRTAAVEAQLRDLQKQWELSQAKLDRLDQFVDDFDRVVAAGNQGIPFTPTTAQAAKEVDSKDALPLPASQIQAERRITPASDEELAKRLEIAVQRNLDKITPVTQADFANIPYTFEWGTGATRRMWHIVNAGTYEEVYEDGSYSLFLVVGRAVVNDNPGIIVTKDDGTLDAFVPDKGGRMEFLLKGASPQATWGDFAAMQNVD